MRRNRFLKVVVNHFQKCIKYFYTCPTSRLPEIVGDYQVTPPLLPVCAFHLFGAAVDGQGSDGGLGLRFSKISVILRKGGARRWAAGQEVEASETEGSHRRSGT
jgi:hypothetical protein